MTQEEFDKAEFAAECYAIYKGNKYPIASVDFHERLIGLEPDPNGGFNDGELHWVRCENIDFIPRKKGE